MNEYEFHLGALIAEKRNQAGISKKQLAELCGYTKIAKGIRRPLQKAELKWLG